MAQFLAEKPSELKSGRVPALECEECGDVACGAFAVRVVRQADSIVWTDWLYENGYESGHPLDWSPRPGDLVFELNAYEAAIRMAL